MNVDLSYLPNFFIFSACIAETYWAEGTKIVHNESVTLSLLAACFLLLMRRIVMRIQPYRRQAPKTRPTRKLFRRPELELLEERTLLAINLMGVPNWVEQGPGPTLNGQAEGIPNNPVVGAVNAVVADPTNADILYLGAVNGGVWRTRNATAANPTWTPLTDQFPSLSIGALALDPTDITNQTLVAGIGRFSSFYGTGGPLTGLLRTTDGGDHWVPLGQTGPMNLLGENIRAVVPRGNTIFVAANDGASPGVYRSVDGGGSFQFLSGLGGLANGPVFDLFVDPANPNIAVAGVGDGAAGIYVTMNANAPVPAWGPMNDPTVVGLIGAGGLDNIKLAVHFNPMAGTEAYYAGIDNNGQLAGVVRLDVPTMTFTGMLFPGVVGGDRAIAAATNAAPIVITSPGHGLVNGDQVQISGVRGNTAANGNFVVTQVDADRFSLNGSVGNGAYAGGGSWGRVNFPITAATNAAPIVITSNNHGLRTGNQVQITGVLGNTAANGNFVVTRVDANRFALNGSTGNGAYTGGGTWSQIIGAHPGGQGSSNFSIVADPINANVVYIGGDRQDNPLNSIGAIDYSGRLFRGDASRPPETRWVHLTNSNAMGPAGGGTASNTSPHADSRRMVVDRNGDLLEADDGGIYRRTRPQDNTGDWSSLNGTSMRDANNRVVGGLRVTEFHNVAWDSTHAAGGNGFIIGGAQDTGTPQQLNTGTPIWNTVPTPVGAQGFSTGDGGAVAVDNLSLGGGQSIRYSSFNNLGDFRRQTYNNGVLVAGSQVYLAGAASIPDTQFVTPIKVNQVNAASATRLLIGGFAGVYESTDRGATITSPTGLAITGATNAMPITITAPGHGFANGDAVFISGVGGNVAANGYWFVANANMAAGTFDLMGSDGRFSGVYVAGTGSAVRTFKPITGASNTAPITITAAGHGLANGDQVLIARVQGNTAANGLWTVTNVTPNTFDLVGSDGTASGAYVAGTGIILYHTGANADGGGTAMAYGGMRGGVANPNVFYVASGSRVLVRTAAGGPVVTTNPGGGTIRGVAMDPTDWMIAYAIDDSHVYMTPNAGGMWVDITGNLPDNNLRSVVVIPNGAGVNAVLVGGIMGVSRMLTNNVGVWSKFGTGLPNAPAYDLDYNAADNVLLVGTLGRGAWIVPNVRDSVFANGTLVINGDMDFAGENDTIRLARNPANPLLLDVFVNNATPNPNFEVEFAALQQIIVNGLGGINTILIQDLAPGVSLTVNGGGGNDTVIVGSAGNRLDSIQGPITVNGAGAAAMSLVLNDQGTNAAQTYTVTNNVVTRMGGLTINYANIVSLTLNGGNGGNLFNIRSTRAMMTTIVNMGFGGDTVAIGGLIAGLFDVLGPIFVNGVGGLAALIFNDQANAAPTTYTITPTIVSRPGWTFTYAGVTSLTFNGGSGNDVYNILGTVLTTVTTVNTGAGVNVVAIGGPVNGLFDVLGPLFVNGVGSPAALVFNDQVNPFNTTYTITPTIVSRPGWVFTYSGVNSLVFNGGFGNDVYNILGTALITVTTVNTGAGVNVVAIGGPVNGLFDILGPLFVNGVGSPAALVFNDQVNPFNTTYTVTPTTVSRPGWTFTYSGVNSLVFNGGSGNDVYNILGTALGTATTVNVGSNANTFNIGGPVSGLSDIRGPLAVNAGAGPNTVNFDDRAYAPVTTYTVTATTLRRPGFMFTYFNVQFMNLHIRQQDAVDVQSLPPGMDFRVFRY
jgi:hypothetical protein